MWSSGSALVVVSSQVLGFPCDSAGKESACNAGDLGLVPGLGRSPRERKGYPLQYSGLKNSHGQRSLQAKSMGSQRVGHYWATKHSTARINNSSIFSFLRKLCTVSTVAAPRYISTNSVWGLPFLHILNNIYYLFFFSLMIAIVIGVRWYLILVLICIYLYLVMLSMFSSVCWPSAFLLWKNVYSFFLPILKSSCLGLWCWVA